MSIALYTFVEYFISVAMGYCPINLCNIYSQMGVFVINENTSGNKPMHFSYKIQNLSVKYDNHTLNTSFTNLNHLSIISCMILLVHNSFLCALPFFSTVFSWSSAASFFISDCCYILLILLNISSIYHSLYHKHTVLP